MKTRKIRYAVVGQGYFAQKAILPAFKHSKNSELVALVSGDSKKLKELGRKYKVKHLYTYQFYDQLLKSGLIDAVYIALPNWMHREFAEQAARNGIHVLCEKPMALSVEECDSMIREADHHGVKLMVAYRLHFEEANLKAIQTIKSRKIGDPRIFNSVFSFPVKEGNIRAKPERIGGGPVYDIGIYCINAARYLFRDEPISVYAIAGDRPNKKLNQINESVSVSMLFPQGRVASFTCSYAAGSVGFFEVVGTKGDICLDEAYEYYGEKEEWLTVGEKSKYKKYGKRDQIAPELEYFSNCILKNKEPEPSGYEGLIDVMIIEAIHRSLDTGLAVPLSIAPRKRRPTLKQEIRKPKVTRVPELIHAQEPTKKAA